MSRAKYRLCMWIMKLDRIPRYGRSYAMIRPADPEGSWTGPAQWGWQKHGHWGLNLLNKLGWLWEFVDENQRRHGGATNTDD